MLTLGMRFDDHEYFGDNWSPRAYLVYHLTPTISLKAGVAKAFKAPSIRQVNPNYATASGRGSAAIYGNPDLKPETSWTEEVGVVYANDSGLLATVTLFNTDFKNKITNNTTDRRDASGNTIMEYTNIGKARNQGVETSLAVPFLDDFKFTAAYTYIYSKRLTGEELFGSGKSTKGQPLTLTPKHKADFKLDWQATPELNTYIRVDYTGRQNYTAMRSGHSTGPRWRDEFTTTDIGASYVWNENVRFNAAVLNIFDHREKNMEDATGVDLEVVEDGRRFWLGMVVDF